MPWNEPGGNQQDPWTGKNKKPGKHDAEEIINKLNQKLGGLFGGGKNSPDSNGGNGGSPVNLTGIIVMLVLMLGGWLFSGFYMVDAREQALVLRFGAYSETTGPGLHWHLPTPIERVEAIDVAQNRTAQDRSTMLTQDENIVEIAVTAQYRVSKVEDYAFNIYKPDHLPDQSQGTLYQAMRSATREVVGRSKMDFILGEGREQIALDTQKLMQGILDNYKSGLQVLKVNLTDAAAPEAVKDAFDDANRAREDANRFQNEAETYANKVIPDARGQASRLAEEATAYREQAIARAEGDASRFTQLAEQYRKAPDVTRERLYLETMESVMTGTRKVLVDSSGNNMIYLPIGNAPASVDLPAQAAAAAQAALQDQTTPAAPIAAPPRQSRNVVPGQPRENR